MYVEVEGINHPLLIEKRDGTWLYGTTDLSALKYRIEKEKVDRIIYVVDSSQSHHFAQIFMVGKKLGWYSEDTVKIEHCNFGVVLGENKKKLSSRLGIEKDLFLIDLLENSIEEAKTTLGGLEDTLPETVSEYAKDLGVGSLKYFDLSHKRTSDYVFSFSDMLSFKGNTCLYINYAYARINSIFDKLSASSHLLSLSRSQFVPLDRPLLKEERDLLLSLCTFRDVLHEIENTLQPHFLCEYSYNLAYHFHSFYSKCRVVSSEEGEDIQLFRIQLCDLVRNALFLSLQLLGVKPIKKLGKNPNFGI